MLLADALDRVWHVGRPAARSHSVSGLGRRQAPDAEQGCAPVPRRARNPARESRRAARRGL